MGNTAYSTMKVLYHTEKIEDIKQGRRTAPVYIRLKPTNVCNQKCYYCVYADQQVFDKRKVDRRESIPWEKMQEIITDMIEMGVKAVTLSGGGEPLCYHSIIPTLRMLRESGMDYSIITNAQELNGEKAELLSDAKWVRISMDAADSETYEKIRKVNTYQGVIANIADFAKIKSEKCELGINFVVNQDNYSSIYEFCRKMKEIGVNNIKFSPLMIKNDTAEYHKGIKESVESQLQRATEELSEEKFAIIDKYSDDMLLEKEFCKEYSRCYMKELFTVIAADQRVYTCHQRAYMPEGLIGDIRNQPFRELWFSDETTEFFKKMDARKQCNFRCAFEERNMLLNDLFSLDKNHINFI